MFACCPVGGGLRRGSQHYWVVSSGVPAMPSSYVTTFDIYILAFSQQAPWSRKKQGQQQSNLHLINHQYQRKLIFSRLEVRGGEFWISEEILGKKLRHTARRENFVQQPNRTRRKVCFYNIRSNLRCLLWILTPWGNISRPQKTVCSFYI